MIRKLSSGDYRLYSRKVDPKTGKRRNLGTFKTRAAAEKHERAVHISSGMAKAHAEITMKGSLPELAIGGRLRAKGCSRSGSSLRRYDVPR
jgi:hypothetical protein